MVDWRKGDRFFGMRDPGRKEETRKNVFRGERGPLPLKRGPPNFWSPTETYPTPENAGNRRKTPENAGKRRKYRELAISFRGTKYLGGLKNPPPFQSVEDR